MQPGKESGSHEHCLGCPTHISLQENLRQYVDRIFNVITKSGVSCPTVMCDIFFSLREAAAKRFQGECSGDAKPAGTSTALPRWLPSSADASKHRRGVAEPHKGF